MQKIISKKLLELEQTKEDFWNIPPETGNHLNLIIKLAGYKNILEIGTSNGYSGLWLAEAVRENLGKLTTIEYSEKRIDLAKKNFEECGLIDFIEIKQGKAAEIIETLDNEYDLIFLDANKAEYIKYFELVDSKLKHKGLLVADNIDSHKKGMQDFLDLILSHPNYQVSCLPFGGGVLLALKLD